MDRDKGHSLTGLIFLAKGGQQVGGVVLHVLGDEVGGHGGTSEATPVQTPTEQRLFVRVRVIKDSKLVHPFESFGGKGDGSYTSRVLER